MHMLLLLLVATLVPQHAGMHFDQDKAVHHFLLKKDGGAIQIDAGDVVTRDAVRLHLRHISVAFAAGDFADPLATHGEVPPGVPVLQRLKTSITYSFEETKTGGSVRLTTTNAAALRAIHEFLRYQIREHRTGDPITPSSAR